jgi:3-phosphoshikimate 1-carboxyvinyltransferase
MLFSVRGGRLHGGPVRLQSNKSSQFLSSLLMVSSYAEQDVCIEIGGTLPSAPYVDITVDVMEEFGVRVDRPDRKQFTVRSGQRYRPATFIVEPDVSGAAAFLAACAIAGGEVVIGGLNPRSKQGDIGFFDVLRRMGCRVGEEGGQISLKSGRNLKGIEVDMNSMPDCVPALASVALFAEGKTRITGVGHLRFKESDRLAAIAGELPKLGAKVSVQDSGLEIEPGPLRGAQLDTYDDHRLAMSFALIGLRVPGVRIENPECVRKSFPGFWKEFEKLYQLK